MRKCGKSVRFYGWMTLLVAGGLLLAGCGQGSASVAQADGSVAAPPPPPVLVPQDASAFAPQENSQLDARPAVGAPPASDGSNSGDASPTAEQPASRPTDVAAEPVNKDQADGTAAPSAEGGDAVAADVDAGGPKLANPFERRLDIPEFPKTLKWLNSRPLTKSDLKGKFVLLDFWTYCCINCMHILPELKKLEQQYPNNLVVIGVHSAKFETEREADNIREAILRYEIAHPVINDSDHVVWNGYGVSSWPTLLLIDPEGMAVWGKPGERKAEEVSALISAGLPYYRQQKLLNEKPLKFELEKYQEQQTPLSFPGKVMADESGGRLFITDSNHNRIVISTLDGKLLDIIGRGDIGRDEGDYKTATFNHPQGCALAGDILYVADTENHLLRKVDLKQKLVTTIAGTGEQGQGWPGWNGMAPAGKKPMRYVGPPTGTPLSSPWALWVHKNELFIAMAGLHQIWMMPLDEKEIGPFAGNGREDIIDGALLPALGPFRAGSAFAQPSGLSSDNTWLYVADSEGSSIRAVPFNGHGNLKVKTIVGSDLLSEGRLFAFGDKDGPRATAKLQHCLEVVFAAGKLYVADTYNHKIKVVDPKTGETKTLVGTGKPGAGDSPAEFHEPAGLAFAKGKLYVADTNNNLIRTIDLATNKVATLTIAGLNAPSEHSGPPVADTVSADPPAGGDKPKKPSFNSAHVEKLPLATVKATDGIVNLHVSLKIPAGWKINPLAPMTYWLDSPRPAGAADRAAFGRTKLDPPAFEFEVPVHVKGVGDDELHISLNYYYCQTKDDGVCKVGAVVFTVPLKVAEGGDAAPVKLVHSIPE